ncbi:PKD domain-containing protein [Hymenobacter qilianensis]
MVSCAGDAEDPKPVTTAAFTSSRSVVEVNEPVAFTDASQHAERYLWDFGNGQTSTLAAPSITYAATGTYTVSLTTYTADNQPTSTTQSIKVGKRYLREIQIKALDFLAPDGTSWDAGGTGPDVFLQLRPTSATEAPYAKTSVFNNVKPADLPLAFAASAELTPGEWTVVVRDEDSASDDKMREWSLPVAGPTPNRDAQGNGYYTLQGPSDNPSAWSVILRYETR